MKYTRRPSGEKHGDRSDDAEDVSRRTSFPSSDTAQMSCSPSPPPARSDANTTHRPSGDQLGSTSSCSPDACANGQHPYAIIATLLVLTRLDALPLKRLLLTAAKVRLTSLLGQDGLDFAWAPLNNPGLMPFVIVALGASLWFGLRGRDIARLAAQSERQIRSSAIAIAASVAMVQVMVFSAGADADMPGMLTAVAQTASSLMGQAYPVISPVIGVLGTFFAGSCTVSGILFVTIQYDTARLLGLPETTMVALQLVGGGIGSMIRVSGVVAACATVNAAGKEASLILRCCLPTLVLTLLALLAAWALYL